MIVSMLLVLVVVVLFVVFVDDNASMDDSRDDVSWEEEEFEAMVVLSVRTNTASKLFKAVLLLLAAAFSTMSMFPIQRTRRRGDDDMEGVMI